MVGLPQGKVLLVNYNPVWSAIFEEEQEILYAQLANIDFSIDLVSIHHVGSTAIEGLKANPIIDMHLLVNSVMATSTYFLDFDTMVLCLSQFMLPLGYSYREDNSSSSKILFAKGPEESRTVYLHVFPAGSIQHLRALAFRNYLRHNFSIRMQYEQLKIQLASKYPDERAKYTDGKAEFINGISDFAYNARYHEISC